MGPDLLRSMRAPSLAMLLARSRLDRAQQFDAFARALPHEQWLSAALSSASDVTIDAEQSNSAPMAVHMLAQFESAPNVGTWFILQPVHLHVARDHLVLTDLRRLALDENESRQLFAVAQTVCADYGHTVVYGDAMTWFLRADAWHDLRTATPDAACGHNIDIWMPTGSNERAWRKLQNEIQMHWHESPVNQLRQSAGKNPVNSVWLWGGAQAGHPSPLHRYQQGFSSDEMRQYVGAIAQHQHVLTDRVGAVTTAITTAATTAITPAVTTGNTTTLVVIDNLIAPALAEDLGEWLLRINAMEDEEFAPLLAAIRSGTVEQCRLVLTNGSSLQERVINRTALRKFWQTPSLSALLA